MSAYGVNASLPIGYSFLPPCPVDADDADGADDDENRYALYVAHPHPDRKLIVCYTGAIPLVINKLCGVH